MRYKLLSESHASEGRLSIRNKYAAEIEVYVRRFPAKGPTKVGEIHLAFAQFSSHNAQKLAVLVWAVFAALGPKKPGELCGSRTFFGIAAKSKIPLVELVSEFFIQRSRPYLQEQMGAATTPAHLLLFDESLA